MYKTGYRKEFENNIIRVHGREVRIEFSLHIHAVAQEVLTIISLCH